MEEKDKSINEELRKVTEQTAEETAEAEVQEAKTENSEAETQDEKTETVSEKSAKKKKEKKPKSVGREIFEWAYSIAIAVLVAFLIKGFIVDLVSVDGNSMYPTLHDKEKLIVTRFNYEPEVGDVIILDSKYKAREAHFAEIAKEQNKDELSMFAELKEKMSWNDSEKKAYSKIYYVKRVIATEGQTVDIHDGKVYVDGKELKEDYINGQTFATDATVKYPFTVSEGCVFVLGDNREHSSDSRISSVGEIPGDAILGKAQLRIWPLNRIGRVK